jgi:hypothetical protein
MSAAAADDEAAAPEEDEEVSPEEEEAVPEDEAAGRSGREISGRPVLQPASSQQRQHQQQRQGAFCMFHAQAPVRFSFMVTAPARLVKHRKKL